MKNSVILILYSILLILFLPINCVKAECICTNTSAGGFYRIADCTNCQDNTCNSGYTCSNSGTGSDSSGDVTLPNPLGSISTPNQLINRIIQGVLGVVGSLALAMFIFGGLTWMTAAGNQTRVQKGRDILVWATIGLVVIFSAYSLVYFVLRNVLGGGGTTPGG